MSNTMDEWRRHMELSRKFGEWLGMIVESMRRQLPPAMFEEVTSDAYELVSPNHAHWWIRTGAPDHRTRVLASTHVQFSEDAGGFDISVMGPDRIGENGVVERVYDDFIMVGWSSLESDPKIAQQMIDDFVRGIHKALSVNDL